MYLFGHIRGGHDIEGSKRGIDSEPDLIQGYIPIQLIISPIIILNENIIVNQQPISILIYDFVEILLDINYYSLSTNSVFCSTHHRNRNDFTSIFYVKL